jgi:hypothetical protein
MVIARVAIIPSVPALLTAHRARFTLLDGDGRPAGIEDLEVDTGPDEVVVSSRIEAGPPYPDEVLLDWHLDEDLQTRLLHIASRDRWGVLHELEAAVTGNGMLAHRIGPDGPSQVELGWGPDAEFNHLSAAFSEVILMRSARRDASTRVVSAVILTTDELEPVVARQRYRLLGESPDGVREYECLTLDSGRRDVLRVSPAGVLLEYRGLLQLVAVEPPTK